MLAPENYYFLQQELCFFVCLQARKKVASCTFKLVLCCFFVCVWLYWNLCEDRQQQWEDSQVGSDPLSSETTAQVLRHRHDLNTHISPQSKHKTLWVVWQLLFDSSVQTSKIIM